MRLLMLQLIFGYAVSVSCWCSVVQHRHHSTYKRRTRWYAVWPVRSCRSCWSAAKHTTHLKVFRSNSAFFAYIFFFFFLVSSLNAAPSTLVRSFVRLLVFPIGYQFEMIVAIGLKVYTELVVASGLRAQQTSHTHTHRVLHH